MLGNDRLAIVEIDLDPAGMEPVFFHRNDGPEQSDRGDRQAESQNKDHCDRARQTLGRF